MEIRITEELNEIIKYSRQEALRTGSYGIAPDHLFLAILRHSSNTAADTLKMLHVDVGEMKQFIDSKIFTNEVIPYSEVDSITFSRGTQNVLSIAVLEATRFGSPECSSQHLLLALIRTTTGYGSAYLRDTGVEYRQVVEHMERCDMLVVSHDKVEAPREEAEDECQVGECPENKKKRSERLSPLDEFGYDLTKAAAEGRLDPVVGREKEIDRVVQILGRRKKNNPMLVGDPGVGKSAIVEGIAQKIASGDVPEGMQGKRIVSLDIGSVVAGTKYRGDFEKRLKAIIGEISGNKEIILFVDEFHTMVGAGGAGGSLDAANMLKPALARGEIQCIGATTMDEFTKIVEKDGALDRRFQKLVVEPATQEQTLSILHNIRKGYEEHHGVKYSDGAIEACVALADRYITDRFLPDKAIDAMDEAGSMVRLRGGRNQNAKVTGRQDGVILEVKTEDIAAVISRMTGIPAGKIAQSEGNRIMKMEEHLRNRVVGQDEAVQTVAAAIRRSRAGIKDPGRPIGTFMFLGPTGVGKTQLAKSIAEYLFDSQDNLIRIDMSEYTEKFTASRLVGAPPGYVGFEEGGQLSEKVRRKPYSVVLLDEIEKAHPDIFNLLLQVLDEGRLTDSNGRTVDFRNTILIMTSNVGSREIEEFGNGMGFTHSGIDRNANRKSVLEKAVRKVFPPEFINRVDELVYFNSLEKKDIESIIDIDLREVRLRVLETGYRLNVTPAAKRLVADAGYDPKYGARPLRRAIQKYIENPVSEFIIVQKMMTGGKGSEKNTLRVGVSSDRQSTEVTLV